MSRQRKPPPTQWLVADGTWPDGPFRPDTPGYVRTAAGVAARINAHLRTHAMTAAAFAAAAGIDPGTLSRVLSGSNLPDLHTLHAVELAAGTALWDPFTAHP